MVSLTPPTAHARLGENSVRGIERRILVLIGVVLIAYYPTSNALWHFWIDHPSWGAHGILVALLALGLLYRARARVAAAPVRALPWLLLPLLLFSIASLLFWRAGLQSLQLLMLPVLILLGAMVAFGIAVTRAIAVPVGFLYFGMPVWNLLAVPLQQLTLAIVRLVAPLIGAASVEGTVVSFPGDLHFEVTIWCSGLGFLVQGLAVATLLGELEQASNVRRLRLMGSMVAVALAANWLRVLAIIELGYSSGMRNLLATRYHLLFGYVVFVIALVAFVWIAARQHQQHSQAHGAPAAAPISTSLWPYMATLSALIVAPVAFGLWTFLH
jgi:exosortase